MAKSKSRSTIYEVSVHPIKNANIEEAIKQFGNASGFFKAAANFYIAALNNAAPPAGIATPAAQPIQEDVSDLPAATPEAENQTPTEVAPPRKRRLGSTGATQSFKTKFEE